jgi:hypothetical protein
MPIKWDPIAKEVDGLNPGVYTRKLSECNDVLLAYGGWGVQNNGAQAWANALITAPKFKNVGVVVAVRGPVDWQDGKWEASLKNSEIVKLVQKQKALGTLYVIAHSSGSSFLREFLGQLGKAKLDVNLEGWNLDGFALSDKRVKYIKHTTTHMQLVNLKSKVQVPGATKEQVNADYVAVDTTNVCTWYLTK